MSYNHNEFNWTGLRFFCWDFNYQLGYPPPPQSVCPSSSLLSKYFFSLLKHWASLYRSWRQPVPELTGNGSGRNEFRNWPETEVAGTSSATGRKRKWQEPVPQLAGNGSGRNQYRNWPETEVAGTRSATGQLVVNRTWNTWSQLRCPPSWKLSSNFFLMADLYLVAWE